MEFIPGKLQLGHLVHQEGILSMDEEMRKRHFYVVGATGTGKSKFLEMLIRQDIVARRYKPNAGLLLLDAHGSLYKDLTRWLSWWEHEDLPIVCIDPGRHDFVVAYNLLRSRTKGTPSVFIRSLVDSMAHVWGDATTDETPTFEKWGYTVLRTLYERGYTTNEAIDLLNNELKDMRSAIIEGIDDKLLQRHWGSIKNSSTKQFEIDLLSTINRFQRLLENECLSIMFGQTGPSFDFDRAIEEGWIVLVNTSEEGGYISNQNSRMLGTILLDDLWNAVKNRGKGDDVRPFNVYIDEFQRFLTPTIAEDLSEARGYGLRMTMAHQYPGQLTKGPKKEIGEAIFSAVMNCAQNKVVFHLEYEEEMLALASSLFFGTFDPDLIKDEIYSTKVMEYVMKYMRAYGSGRIDIDGSSTSKGSVRGHGDSGSNVQTQTTTYDADGLPVSTGLTESSMSAWQSHFSDTMSDTLSSSTAFSESESYSPMVIPVLGQEMTSREFRNLDEQRFFAMAALFDQAQRQAVARLYGMRRPVSIFTPWVKPGLSTEKGRLKFIAKVMKQHNFSLPLSEARMLIEQRRRSMEQGLLEYITDDEPESFI